MSNIITSYLRIRKTNGTHLSEIEQEKLFRALVNWHGEFGSYWVKVVKRYRDKIKCLDIQYGSGKRSLVDPSEYLDDDSEIKVLRRSSNEGSRDVIRQEIYKKGEESEIAYRLCTYAFDRIVIIGDVNWLAAEGAAWFEADKCSLEVSGTYHSANCRSFVDIDIYQGNDQPIYDEDYAYDYFVLTACREIEFTTPAFMAGLTENKFARMPNASKIILYYKFRKVVMISKNYDKLEILNADYWDNCADEFCKEW